jgi:signal transduction histidine kinase
MSITRGIALLCDLQGNISEVLSDTLGFGASLRTGMPFARLAARGGLDKALSFMAELEAQRAVLDWEINLALGGGVKTLHFTGSKSGKTLLLAGAENGVFAQRLFQEMAQQTHHKATNALRVTFKDPGDEASQYDEISRLNNELMAMHRELAKKNAELALLNQEKNYFLGMAAHDLRNPLYIILLQSEFLLQECQDPKYCEVLEGIRNSSEFISRLVEDLLDVANIESGQLRLDYTPLDLPRLVERNVAWNRVLAAKKQINITFESEALPTVMIDSAKFEQILNNLLGNAVKFSEPGSQVEVRLNREGENFLLRVRDKGVGMSDKEQSKLFKIFQHGRLGTEGEKSTGLGLVIVKRIVEGHGGKIWLESQPGAGTTFFVSLPFQPPTW